MNSLLTTITITGFTVAFLHAAIPTHWLPFVLVSRARGWQPSKTLGVVLLAGMGHIALTTLLGLLIAWFGFQLDHELEHVFGPLIGGAMIAIGAYFVWRQLRGKGVCHHHTPDSQHAKTEHCGHGHEGEPSHWERELSESGLGADKGDWAAIGGLFLMLTLSPCEVFLPVYLSAVPFGWLGFVLLSAILLSGCDCATLSNANRVFLARFSCCWASCCSSSPTGIKVCDLGHLPRGQDGVSKPFRPASAGAS